MTVCVVNGCHNTTDKDKKASNITFHLFPSDPIVAARWIEKIRLNRNESYWKPSKSTKICSKHFNVKEIYSTKSGLCRLRRGAVPTKDIPVFSTSKESEIAFNLHGSCLMDHHEPIKSQLNTSAVDADSEASNISLDASIFDTPKQASIRRLLNKKILLQKTHRKKIKTLQQKTRRLIKNNLSLKKIIVQLRKERSRLMILKLGKQITRLCTLSTDIKMSTGDCGVSLKIVTAALENFAPKNLSETWDNTGLLVEPYTSRNITKVLMTNDLTEDVAVEANDSGCEMIISYHPPIFAPLKSVVQSAWKQRIVSFLLEKRIALYSPHTSWDCVPGGVNDWLASAFPFQHSNPIKPGVEPKFGAGRLLQLISDISLSDAVENVKQLTGLNHVRFALGKGKQMSSEIYTVALCAGSGSSVLKGVPADLYLTGEMLHHDILDATQNGISVILTNHSDSERGFLNAFSTDLRNILNNEVDVIVSKLDRDPLETL